VDNNSGEVHSMSHVQLGCWANLFLVMPATANTLAQAACGMAQNLLTQTILSFEGKTLFFPHMNWRMWEKPSVQRNIAQLVMDGYLVCPPIETDVFEQASRSMKKGISLPHFPDILNFAFQHFETAKKPVLEVD
jgi:phosphopantothenoylcysteine synthetase/decarboxylase